MRILLRSHGFPLKDVADELSSGKAVAVAAEPEPDSEPSFQVL